MEQDRRQAVTTFHLSQFATVRRLAGLMKPSKVRRGEGSQALCDRIAQQVRALAFLLYLIL
jgi:hypothetical protein